MTHKQQSNGISAGSVVGVLADGVVEDRAKRRQFDLTTDLIEQILLWGFTWKSSIVIEAPLFFAYVPIHEYNTAICNR